MKICLSFAAGGHFDQLKCLMDAFEGHDILFITPLTVTTKPLKKVSKTYYIRKGPKLISKFINPFLLFIYYSYLLLPSIKLLLVEKPDVIIGCGGEATLNLFYLAKIMGKKLIYIESLARVKDISKTGKLVYPITDLFLVQWEELLIEYQKAKYWGRVI